MDDIPGSGDCEARWPDGVQPVLFGTSWAYVIVGVAIAIWVGRRNDVARGWGWLFAAGLVLTGLGSADYHGPTLAPQPLAHDGGLALALLVAWGIDLARLSIATRRIALLLLAVAAAGTLVLVVNPDSSPLLAGVVAVGLVLAEVLIYRRGLRRWGWTQWVTIGSLAVGVVAFALSRTGGPWCDPDSLVQGHGVWHLLTAIALAFWAIGALAGSSAPTGRTVPVPTPDQTRSKGLR